MTTYTFPEKPSLRQLKIQAKDLLKAVHRQDQNATARLRRFHPEFARSGPKRPLLKIAHLSDVQLVVAREYGFDSWPKMKACVDGINVIRLDDAVKRGDLAEISDILKARPELVNVDVAENDEQKPIHFAVLYRQPEVLRLLLRHGSDPHRGIYPNRDATTAYVLAEERGYDELVAIMDEEEETRRRAMQCANLTVSPMQKELNQAIKEGDKVRFEEVLTQDPELEEGCDGEGRTPMHIAAACHSPAFVKRLLKNWACVRKPDADGRTPLDLAVNKVKKRDPRSYPQFLEVANLLLGHVAPLSPSTAVALGRDKELRAMLSERSVELADDTHWLRGGLLAVAIRHGRQDMAQLLIDSGWDINEPARVETVERDAVSSGRPLWDAAANRDYDSVEMLLQRGADPNVMVYASGGAMERAYNNRDEKMKELLRRHGAGTSPETLGLFRDTEGARAYLQAGPDEDEIRRLLWAAACGGDPETVRMCLPLLKWQRDRSEWFNLLEQPFRM